MTELTQFEVVSLDTSHHDVVRKSNGEVIATCKERRYARIFKEAAECIDPTETGVFQKIELSRKQHGLIENDTENVA